jgi:hypothetical protein
MCVCVYVCMLMLLAQSFFILRFWPINPAHKICPCTGTISNLSFSEPPDSYAVIYSEVHYNPNICAEP